MSELGRVIWTASHNDEGTISAMGADVVAAAVRAHLTSDPVLVRVMHSLEEYEDDHAWLEDTSVEGYARAALTAAAGDSL